MSWAVLGFRCNQCGILGYSPERSGQAVIGGPGVIGDFVDLSSDRRILRAYSLNLYEVIYWGVPEQQDEHDDRDTMYLVAAKDYQGAVDMVDANATHCPYNEDRPKPDVVQEIANNLTRPETTKLLRGPYFQYGVLFGHRAWERDHETGQWKELSLKPQD